MQPLLTIRDASEKDILLIQQLANKIWPSAYGALLSPAQLTYMLDMMYSTDSLRQQLAKGHQFYIAEAAGTVLGFASVSDEGNRVFKLNKLYILPDIQRSGAGKALLEHCTAFARAGNGVQLILQVNRDNPAKGFYEKQGFTVLEEIDLAVGEGFYMNDYIMGKQL
ncbi:GNAT family N-acetyltransferase [Sediminibacterium soli]|uniref:GNAT family N-acetyltransferase n=1 Tax=Sediminibacterium soli TaxID=2698829 RepID=UPI00137B6F80|nr:GNAT family N-acetyltransferase [Sediminibacterium soli]NCI46626.1 GNAT family N-acetyltransferase [Sediminibacterium soli]